jgi:hypothetical protein
MPDLSLSGAKTYAYESVRGTKIVAIGALDPNDWFEVAAVASAASGLPIQKVGAVFRTPDTGSASPVTMVSGDEVWPLTLTRICKTDAEVNFEEGTIDVTDDCEEGYTAVILDGYKKISGTLNGFAKFDDETQELNTNTADLFNKFINKITDDGDGVYVETVADNAAFILFILMNRTAAVDDIQNWIIVPAVLTNLGAGAGLKDAQKRDLTWEKAQGYASLYQRTVFADDVVT